MDQSQLGTSCSFACHWPKAGSVDTSTFKGAGGCRPSICMGQGEPESYGLTELGSRLSIGCIYIWPHVIQQDTGYGTILCWLRLSHALYTQLCPPLPVKLSQANMPWQVSSTPLIGRGEPLKEPLHQLSSWDLFLGNNQRKGQCCLSEYNVIKVILMTVWNWQQPRYLSWNV